MSDKNYIQKKEKDASNNTSNNENPFRITTETKSKNSDSNPFKIKTENFSKNNPKDK